MQTASARFVLPAYGLIVTSPVIDRPLHVAVIFATPLASALMLVANSTFFFPPGTMSEDGTVSNFVLDFVEMVTT